MDDEEFGTTANYLRAFEAVRAEGIPAKHMALLRAHLAAPEYTTTWARLGETVGYPNGNSVNLQYGRFAERIARHLGLSAKPLDPHGTAWWLWVLVRWASERDPSGHTAFVLRHPAIEAAARIGIGPGEAMELLPDELDAAASVREGARYQVLVNAYERNPEARRRCIAAHGTACCICGFSFGERYGPEAEGYIHVHHVRPLSEVGGEYLVDPVEDLRPVCPNCHAVLHLGGRCRTIDEVRQLLR
jgi:5-methylcytosine-specific restriction enzyme A